MPKMSDPKPKKSKMAATKQRQTEKPKETKQKLSKNNKTAKVHALEVPKPPAQAIPPSPPAPQKDDQGIRRFTLASFRSRLKRRQADRRISRTPVNHSFRIFNRALGMLWRHWEVFGGLLLMYELLGLLLVGGGIVNGERLQSTKDAADAAGKTTGAVGTGAAVYGYILQNGLGLVGGAASAYQTIIFVIFSLAFVWSLRQFFADNRIRVRDALYNSSYSLIQVLLTLLMVFVHLIPAVVGMYLFGTLVMGGIILGAIPQLLVALMTLLLISWSAYLLTASIFALYIATLPNMTPLAALRTAKRLVKFRRAMILRKLLYLPLVLVPLLGVLIVPLVFLYTPIALLVFYLLINACMPLAHSYIYTLYRDLIRE
jgi:hypothetical protein